MVELVAACDINDQAARAAAEAVGPHVATFTDFDEMLETTELDAVDICTPHHLHAPQTIAAANAGKHVLLEKPMACSIAESQEMVAAAEAAGVTFMIAQNLRYMPGSVGIRKLIDSGDLGQIWWARADDWFGLLSDDHKWAYDARLAGGGVLHMGGTHHIDLFRFFFGEIGAVRAHCWAENPLLKNGAEDRAVATLEFHNGAVAQLSACYVPFKTPHRHQYMMFGESGSVHTTLPEAPEPQMTSLLQHQAPALVSSMRKADDTFEPVPPIHEASIDGTQYSSYPVEPEFAVPYVNEILHFASCVRENAAPLSSGRDNVETMKAVYGCYESARSGRTINLAEL